MFNGLDNVVKVAGCGKGFPELSASFCLFQCDTLFISYFPKDWILIKFQNTRILNLNYIHKYYCKILDFKPCDVMAAMFAMFHLPK